MDGRLDIWLGFQNPRFLDKAAWKLMNYLHTIGSEITISNTNMYPRRRVSANQWKTAEFM